MTLLEEINHLKDQAAEMKNAYWKLVYDAQEHSDRLLKFRKKLAKKGGPSILREFDEILLKYADDIESSGKMLKSIK